LGRGITRRGYARPHPTQGRDWWWAYVLTLSATPGQGGIMKVLPFSCAFLTLLSAHPAAGREFTNAFGQTIEAEIQSVRAPNVVLVRGDGKTFVLPVAKLSEADQKYVKQWAVDNPDINFDYRFEKEKLSSEKKDDRAGSTTIDTKTEKWIYKVTVQNRSLTDVEGLTFEYTIFKQRKDSEVRKKTISGSVQGKMEVAKIERQRSFVIKTDPITTEDIETKTKIRQEEGGFDTDHTKSAETLTGIKIVAKLKDKIVDTKEYGIVD
jgi:hypothetical protein